MTSPQPGNTPAIQARAGGAPRYFPEVESLRGVAIALVFLRHADAVVSLGLTSPAAWPLATFVRAGHTGVSLFFVISGFLLSLPFLEEANGGRRVRRGRYYMRRALRILPLYYVAVITAALLAAKHPGDVWRALPYLLFLNGAGLSQPLPPYDAVWWSLATEVQFYLLLPLLPLFLRSRRSRALGVVMLLVYAAAYAAFIGGCLHLASASAQLLLALSAFGRAPLFLCGIGSAWVFTHWGEDMRAACARWPSVHRGGGDLVLFVILMLLALLLHKVVVVGFWRAEAAHHGWHVFEGLLWAAVVLLLLHVPLRAKWLLSNRIFERLGTISYSVYLIHMPLLYYSLTTVRRLRPQWLVTGSASALVVQALVAITCVAFSTFTYRTIERPFLDLKRRVG